MKSVPYVVQQSSKGPITVLTPQIEIVWSIRAQLTHEMGETIVTNLNRLLEAAGIDVPEGIEVIVELANGRDTVSLTSVVREIANVAG